MPASVLQNKESELKALFYRLKPNFSRPPRPRARHRPELARPIVHPPPEPNHQNRPRSNANVVPARAPPEVEVSNPWDFSDFSNPRSLDGILEIADKSTDERKSPIEVFNLPRRGKIRRENPILGQRRKKIQMSVVFKFVQVYLGINGESIIIT